MGQVGRFRIAYAIDTEFERGTLAEVDVSVSEPRLDRDHGRTTSVLHHAEETQTAGQDGCGLRPVAYGKCASSRRAMCRHAHSLYQSLSTGEACVLARRCCR